MENEETKKTQKKMRKVILFASLFVANVFAVGAVTFAWFMVLSKETNIAAFSGDLNVDIDKVTAYKYIYPYFEKSSEFIDYNADPTLKKYVVQDADFSDKDKDFGDSTTIPLGDPLSGTYVTSSSSNLGPKKIYGPESPDFRYYLAGDEVFSGIDGFGWTLANLGKDIFFAETENISAEVTAVAHNVVISAGAKLTLIDVRERDGSSLTCFSYDDPVPETDKDSRFEIVKEDEEDEYGYCIQCVQGGIYDVSYSTSGITFELSRSDDAAIGNNLLDPTKIKIDHASGMYDGEAEYDGTINSIIPYAIEDQKTMVVFDVELTYKNANPVTAGLKIYRGPNSPISSDPNTYSTENFTTGVLPNGTGDRLYASDFYAFYAVFTKEANAYASASSMWTAMHKKTNEAGFARFQNTYGEYDRTLPYSLNLKESSGVNADSLTIPSTAENSGGSQYHCYIGVDYDHQRVPFFLNENRLGKTYYLDRDFGFLFCGTQIVAGS